MTSKKRKPPLRLYTIKLDGELDGFELEMSGMTTSDLIAISAGDLPAGQALELALRHVVSHNFDIDDLRDLDARIANTILSAWSQAVLDSALPPESATS